MKNESPFPRSPRRGESFALDNYIITVRQHGKDEL